MLLDDATSAEEVAAALDAGDEELREDIDDQLKEAERRWENDNKGYDWDQEPVDVKEIFESESFINDVIHESPYKYDLSKIPRGDVEEALRYAAVRPRGGRETRYGPFYIDTRGGDHFTHEWETGGRYTFYGRFLPKKAEFIPSDIAHDFWLGLDNRLNWDQTSSLDHYDDNYASGPGEKVYVDASEEDFTEWCRDLVAEFVRAAVKNALPEAKEIFFAALAEEDKALAEKVKSAGLDDEDLTAMISTWFEDESEQSEIVDSLREHFAALDEDVGVPNEVIAQYTREDIGKMGIRGGTLFENAPWKLIKLRAADLRLEGTRMGHCVGKKDMGYVKAVKDGEVEIWSLRSRDDKPRFTLEVDPKFYIEDETEPQPGEIVPPPPAYFRGLRAQAIEQLKGKANRTPGYADVRKTGGLKFPDEVFFWAHALNALGVDPEQVSDFDAFREQPQVPGVQPNGEICTGFDLPYRPRVRQNRRSSKRRSSRR